jgi:hypothetical protein
MSLINKEPFITPEMIAAWNNAASSTTTVKDYVNANNQAFSVIRVGKNLRMATFFNVSLNNVIAQTLDPEDRPPINIDSSALQMGTGKIGRLRIKPSGAIGVFECNSYGGTSENTSGTDRIFGSFAYIAGTT